MTSATTHHHGERTARRAMPNRRRWSCPKGDCTQERITPLDTAKAPICPVHACNMTKRRKVTRRGSR